MPKLLARAAFPLFIFSFVLALALLLSWWFFLPRLAGVPLHGELLRGPALIRFYTDLRERVEAEEGVRNQLVLPGQDPLSQFLHTLRRSDVSLLPLYTALQRVAEGIVPDHTDAITLESFQYDATHQTLTVSGDVRHVGPRSMTVIAEFTEALQSIPVIRTIWYQRFTREEDAKGTFHSPFTLLLRLSPVSS